MSAAALMKFACLYISHFFLACEIETPAVPAIPAAPSERVAGIQPAESAAPIAVADGRTILDASPEAERAGVRPGQGLRQALGCCPLLAVLEARPVLYERHFTALLDALLRISPLVEPGPPGVAFADLRGLQALFPQPGALPRALLHCAPPGLRLRVQAGIGPGKFPALVAARWAAPGEAYVLRETRVAVALAPAPVSWLPVPEEIKRRLQLVGITTLGALAALPRAAVAAQFGPLGNRMWELAQGRDAEPLQPYTQQEAVLAQMSFDPPASGRQTIIAAASQLLDQTLNGTLDQQRAPRRALLRATTERGQLWQHVITFKDATGERARMWLAIQTVLEMASFPGPVAEMSLELMELAPAYGRQAPLWPDRQALRRERLGESMRQLKARYGACPVGQVVEVEPWSRVPERRVAFMAFDP